MLGHIPGCSIQKVSLISYFMLVCLKKISDKLRFNLDALIVKYRCMFVSGGGWGKSSWEQKYWKIWTVSREFQMEQEEMNYIEVA